MNPMPHTAMVLAAGLGTRMRPLTDDTPKPLIEVAGKPLMDYALDRFAEAGVARAVVNVHYLADLVEAHVASRKTPEIILSDEREELLETGGGLKKARSLFGDEPVFCTNTDAILIDADGTEACRTLADLWDPARMDALLLLVPTAHAHGYDGKGDFDLNTDGQISFRHGDAAPMVFTGLQILSTRLIDDGPDGRFSTKLLWEKAAEDGRLHGARFDGEWLHVGDPEGLALAEDKLASHVKR